MNTGLFFDLFLVSFVAVGVVYDLAVNKIPNWFIASFVTIGLLINALTGVPYLLGSLLGLVVGIGALIIPFAMGWMGAGDVKFFGAVGAALGVQWLPRVFFYAALSGLLIALIFIALRGTGAKTLRDGWSEFKLLVLTRGQLRPPTVAERVSKGAVVVPFGVAIGFGTLMAYYGDPRGQWAGF